MTINVVTAIIQEQKKLGLSDGAFARLIERDVSEWSRVSRGLRRPSLAFLTAVVRKLPSLQMAVFNSMVEK